MRSDNKFIGKQGEQLSCDYLLSKGYTILDRNYRNRLGEIDIIALDEARNVIVFVEVKTRRSTSYGYAYEAVNYKKRQKIIMVSGIYLIDNRFLDLQPRYDIIEVYLGKSEQINHIINAFGEE